MIFGEIGVDEAIGALSVHGVKAGGLSVRKGSVLSAETAAALKAAGISRIVAARLEPGDVGEDAAAHALATAMAGAAVRVEPPFTGRANLFAEVAGLLRLDRARIDAVNAVDEAVTIATLQAYRPVIAGEMIATVKIIPYAVPGSVLRAALGAADGEPAVTVAPYRLSRVGVISTTLPRLKPSTIAKTVAVLGKRLVPSGAAVVAEATCRHEVDALAGQLRIQADGGPELIVVFGASAIADRRDVIPAAIERAGGTVEQFGMPVDPGNLLLVGRIGTVPVIGAPGCARSPKENGFDWVLARMLAGLEVTRADISGFGVGGLLMEIGTRGQPRAFGGARPSTATGAGDPGQDAA